MIREKDGIHIDLSKKVVADSRRASGDLNIVSHAHFDHMHLGDSEVLCSEVTGKLAAARAEEDIHWREDHPDVELIPSGHIIGSRAALIEGEDKILYTGDASIRDRLYLNGFQPPDADVLVVESTYGIPAYSFPAQEVIEDQIRSWVEENRDDPLILFGYSLGKAQKIQHMVQDFTDRTMLAHGSVKKMNDAVEEATDLEFQSSPYGDNREKMKDDAILVAPSSSSKSDWVKKLVDETGALKAGFSGWAATDSFKYRGDYDKTFQLSDHCGFEELVELVKQVDPEKVYTHHGFDEEFASYLKRELGYDARALKSNQASLADF